ncbi:MAG: hypothetical protein ACK5UM_15780 [Pseudomonadota bacterium]|jgi:hypothetical protein|nr:BatD family protein [Rubrivivax sp.]MCA3259060.1 BatD family protein [Rubrivivax sp.]MCZ8032726.1 hypothetical protein [Rubrivivax sp.]
MTRRRIAHPAAAGAAAARRLLLRAGSGLALAAALAPLAAQTAPPAGPAARVRLALERAASRLEVGDAIEVRLEVWVSTWFQGPVDFPSTLTAEGALVTMVGGSPDSRFEEADGLRWTGLIRRYRVLPAQPGEVAVTMPGPLAVIAGGGDGRALRVEPAAPLRLIVRVPPGAEDIQPFVAARRLELRQRWWPEPSAGAASPQTGDLIRREVVLVTDSSSPLLPAPDFGPPDGVALRIQAAEREETPAPGAGAPTLTRRHEAVYTLQRAGAVALPPIELVWWDLARRQRRVATLPGIELQVQPAARRPDPFAVATDAAAEAARAQAEAAAARRGAAASWAAALAAGALAGGALWWRRRRAAGAGTAPPSTQRSEAQACRQLARACRRADAEAADAALHELLTALDPPTRQRWLQQPDLAAAVAELGRHRFGPAEAAPPTASWRGDALWNAVRQLRDARRRARPRAALPALHP